MEDKEKSKARWRAWYHRQKDKEGFLESEVLRTAYRRAARVDWLTSLKKEMCCCRCGFTDYRALCFHHKNPNDKESEVSTLLRRQASKERILREIEKCEVLCMNCHAIEHVQNPVRSPRRENVKQLTKIEWLPDVELLDLLATQTYEAVASQLGVSSNAIRRRLKRKGLPCPPGGYKRTQST